VTSPIHFYSHPDFSTPPTRPNGGPPKSRPSRRHAAATLAIQQFPAGGLLPPVVFSEHASAAMELGGATVCLCCRPNLKHLPGGCMGEGSAGLGRGRRGSGVGAPVDLDTTHEASSHSWNFPAAASGMPRRVLGARPSGHGIAHCARDDTCRQGRLDAATRFDGELDHLKAPTPPYSGSLHRLSLGEVWFV
jgi:hypothetical protein